MTLSRRDLAPDPFHQFGRWFERAQRSGLVEPTAMVLATADTEGRPAARMVLLKAWDERGFVFFTHYDSRKAQELAANPRAALLFWWDRLGWQVRIEGEVEKVSPGVSEAYFAARARESQIGAHASPQSSPVADRAELEARFAAAAERFADSVVPRPANWGGYRLRPQHCEFWSQGLHRLHDRFAYTRTADGGWSIARLAP